MRPPKSGTLAIAAISGVRRSVTRAVTIVPKAAPTTTPTARSTTFPLKGFAHQRTGNPNLQWGFLLLLARRGGELKASDAEASPKLAKQKEFLSKRLEEYFTLDTDPFHPYAKAKGYRTKFTLVASKKMMQKTPSDSVNDDDKRFYDELTSGEEE